MKLHILENRVYGGHNTFGSFWSMGEVKEANFILTNEVGVYIPVQNRVTAWWPDGSIKWAAHTADSSLMGKEVNILPSSNINQLEQEMIIKKLEDRYCIDTGRITVQIPYGKGLPSDKVAWDIYKDGQLLVDSAFPVLWLEHREKQVDVENIKRILYKGEIRKVEIEEDGPLECVIRLEGTHVTNLESGVRVPETMPFIIRMYLGYGQDEIRFQYRFFYDGKEERDFLKGMGIRFETKLTGHTYNRHIRFGTDCNEFHETAVMLVSSYPKLDDSVLAGQIAGQIQEHDPKSLAGRVAGQLPIWKRYSICQDSPNHYSIKKRTGEECCDLIPRHGVRAPGTMAVNGDNGGVLLGIKDFWQKYPSGLEVDGLCDEKTLCTAWFYSPEVEAMDFRHYSTSSYPMTCYEGFPEVGASAYGIGVFNECRLKLLDIVPTDDDVKMFGKRIQKSAIYVGEPVYYHEKRAFGYWGLKREDTPVEIWMEQQLDMAVNFYRKEIEERNWYGLFDYGDVMHSYDSIRHCWKYDCGGYAWQNTELVPTLWLWLYFIRTGREDVFTMAEAMSRHCAEVDIYHFGPYKGIGSRHNVRHWGDSCKEPRISMAGHHRMLYYLTGDRCIGDILEEVRDADHTFENLEHFHVKKEGNDKEYDILVRSGPDWSSFVSNWMTQYERTLDVTYRKKIEQGIEDIKNSPMGLVSGPDFMYDIKSSKLQYIGENEMTPNTHLQICMGGPQVWLEIADMINHEEFRKMLEEYGSFYYQTSEEKNKRTNGLIGKRHFGYLIANAGLAAYSAFRNKDNELAATTWKILFKELWSKNQLDGFRASTYGYKEDEELKEIAWINTNFTSQWCLNIITALDFIRDDLPQSIEELISLLNELET